jgi:hypothetical protein
MQDTLTAEVQSQVHIANALCLSSDNNLLSGSNRLLSSKIDTLMAKTKRLEALNSVLEDENRALVADNARLAAGLPRSRTASTSHQLVTADSGAVPNSRNLRERALS